MIRYGDGKAGQWPKSQATVQFQRHLGTVVTASVIGGGVLGVGLGCNLTVLAVRHFPNITRSSLAPFWALALLIVMVVATTVLVSSRLLDKPLEQIAKERIRLLRAAQTEALVAFALNSLDDHWHLFNGISMKGGGDIDHVLIGPGGLFCISTKNYRGIYTLGENATVLNNGEKAAEVAEAQRLAMKLRNWLEAKLDTFPQVKSIPYVRAVLAVPFMYVAFPAMANNVWIVDEDKLCDLAQAAKQTLSDAQIKSCVALLTDLSRSNQVAAVAKQNEPTKR